MTMKCVEFDNSGWKDLYADLGVPKTESVEIQCQGEMPLYVWATADKTTLPSTGRQGLRIEVGETKTIPPGYDTFVYITSTDSVAVLHY
jgi:hypothetical protein